jgi:isopentenyl-diphosphate delta-isomerase
MDYREELFDVVNRDDEVIQEAVSKKDLHVNDDITRIVTIYVRDRDNRVYIAQRSHTKEIDPLKFEAPAHGRVNTGEDYDTAAHREVAEELGVKLDTLTPVKKYYTSFDTNVGIRQHFKKLYIGTTSGDIEYEQREIETLKSFDSFQELFEYFDEHTEVFSSAIALDMKVLKDFLAQHTLN